LACRLLGIGPEHEVLVPAYNCGTELDAILQSGARVVGYQVSRRCEFELEDLVARRSRHTRAVYLIHYFGWEQPMQELRRWCDEQGLLLIEDCALALFSSGPSGGIGRTGDAAIFSLPKTLGCYHGGLLSLAKSRLLEEPVLAPAGLSTMLKEFQHSMRPAVLQGLERLGLYGSLLSARRCVGRHRHSHGPEGVFRPMPDDYYFQPATDANRALYPQVRKAASARLWEETVRCRRSNYLRLASALERIQGVKPLYERLPDGVCPLSFPVLVSERDACVEALQSRGIAALPWWAGFHRNGIDWSQFPDAYWLKHNLLTLPVHQGVDDQHLAYVAETAAQILESTGALSRPSSPPIYP
jgi:dTDP-4-amino-4,6-dideoxygalactose transaminase